MVTIKDPTLEETAIRAFAAGLRGHLIQPGDDDYDAARRVWNGAIDRRPALIARCAGAADVTRAVGFARDHELLLAVRGGGHSAPGHSTCDGGIVIDLSPMKGVRVDPERRTVRAEAGLTWGELDHETQAFGLAVTGGVVSHTGIAGLTLGGGIGWLARRCGLSCDNVLSADVVTADGRFLTASATENQDLFWGIRGGGGNFGIVTSFEYQLHAVGPLVWTGPLFYPMAAAPEVLRSFRDFMATAPDELGAAATLLTAPPLPFLPPQVRGLPVVAIIVCYTGPRAEGERVLAPLRAVGSPLVDLVQPMPYVALQRVIDDLVAPGIHSYSKTAFLTELSDAAIDTLVTYGANFPTPFSVATIIRLGGAIQRMPAHDTAFCHRDAPYILEIAARSWDEDDRERRMRWATDLWAAMRRFSTGGLYVNFLDDEGETGVKDAYEGATYARLRAVKTKYDPMNLFRLNQNIAPANGLPGTNAGAASVQW